MKKEKETLKKIRERIVEIQTILGDENRRKEMGRGMLQEVFERQLEAENRPLRSELHVLERKEQFKATNRNFWITVFVGISSVVISVIVAFGVPTYQKIQTEQSEIQAVYKNLVVNQDIFISNVNDLRNIKDNGGIENIPETFFEDQISKTARQTIQDKFGLIQYRFFLYYLQQTALLNNEIQQIKDYAIVTEAKSLTNLNPTKKYLATMEYLERDREATKFNYLADSECLQYFFEKTFDFLNVDGRGKILKCDSETLAWRLFYHFGYLPADTPFWLKLELRSALNDREDGLGDRIIQQ